MPGRTLSMPCTITRSPACRPLSTTQFWPCVPPVTSTRGSTLPLPSTIIAIAWPFGSCVTPICGTRNAFSLTPSSMRARTNMPGSSTRCLFGKIARIVTEPVVWSTVTSLNCSLPRSGYGLPSSRISVTFAAPGPSVLMRPLWMSWRSFRPSRLDCVRST